MDNQSFKLKYPLLEFDKSVDRSSQHYAVQLTNLGLDAEKEENSLSSTETNISSKNHLKRKRKYRVDVLLCESLASLVPLTLYHLFHPDHVT